MADAMLIDHRAKLKQITSFSSLVSYLRDEMGWPIDGDDLEPITFDYTPEELGIEAASAAKILEIKRLRPLSVGQPWGIFFVGFEPKRLPVVALRRILSRVVLKKRASANSADRAAWQAEDLLFVSNFGEGDERQICFAHFTVDEQKTDLPTLKVLGWNHLDTMLRLDDVAELLTERLAWPDDENDTARWRERWRSAFPLRHREVITTSKLLAERLAELARAIRAQINMLLAIETEDGPLTKLMEAFREALVHDLDADGFADMYAQTIAYGLLSARIADPKANTADDFAAHMRTNPFLKELMETFLHVGGRRKSGNGVGLDFDELGVSEVVALLDAANMEAVLRDFGDRKPEEDPVIHFYEDFLKAYDAKKRTQRGVFYTPLPVVSYIIRSVHELLQTEFGLADGLADTATWGDVAERDAGFTLPEGVKPTDPFVAVLDPATGTGTFLVEAIEVIHRTLVERWKREGHSEKKILDLWNEYVPKHLLPRLHGYELMMAPYAIAHVKISLKLHETGYRFGSEERARVYLTNALEPAHDFSGRFDFAIPALAHEARAVNTVKRSQRFTVVVGNPPYAGYSVNDNAWIRKLLEAYKRTVRSEERQIQRLSNDYVKFIRLAEHLLTVSSVGVLGFITDSGYLSGILFRDMRAALRTTFERAWLLNLHGVAIRGVDRSGLHDENVFEITQGVAIHLCAKLFSSRNAVHHAELLGRRATKYRFLLDHSVLSSTWGEINPVSPQWFFTPYLADEDYELWPLFLEMIGSGSPRSDRDRRYATGIKTRHDKFVIGWDADDAVARIKRVAQRQEDDETLIQELGLCTTAHFSVQNARKRAECVDLDQHVKEIAYRPFDSRKIVYLREFVCEPKAETMRHMLHPENIAMAVLRRDRKENGAGFFVARGLVAKDLVSNLDDALVWPLYLAQSAENLLTLGTGTTILMPNIADRTKGHVQQSLGFLWQAFGKGRAANAVGPEDIFDYAYALFHSPSYRIRYAEFLKTDFPRLPLTSSHGLFRELARLGAELVALHLVESPIQQAVAARYDESEQVWLYELAKGQSVPVTLSFTGTDKPAVGKVGWSNDTIWIDAVKPKKNAPDAKVTGTIGFRGVAEDVWNFHIGGYQVCEKWLKDRKGRTLAAEDITHYYRIVIALYETIRIMREIDEGIDAHGGWPVAFQGRDDKKGDASEAIETEPDEEMVRAQAAHGRRER